MAGNWEKYIDRSPIICAAGKPSGDPARTLAECLKDYRLADQVTALEHDAGIFKEPPFTYQLPILKNTRNCGIYTESRSVLRPEVKTRYQTLINDLKETSYDSYWNKQDGKCRDPIPGLPTGMDIVNTTFGKPTNRVTTVKDLVNPPKTVYQVLWDSQVGHDMYKKTHDDYNPGEQAERGYLQPSFDPHKRYGMRSGYDPRGIWVRCACHWHNTNPITSVYKIQADVTERQHAHVGKVFEPNKNSECVPKEHMYGKPSDRGMYGVADLLRDPECPPCIFKRDFHDWIKLLNQLRISLKKRFNEFGLDLKEFQNHCLYYDKEKTGWIPLQLFYHLCGCYSIPYQHECLEPFFNFVGVIMDDKINYRDFVFLADINSSVPEIIKIEDVPKGSQYYISTMKAAACDYLFIDNSKKHIAGTPCVRVDLLRPIVPSGGCKADLESLGDETTAAAVVNPSIYTAYGLTYRDFFVPRLPETMKKIFENIGYEFPDDTFEKLWKIGVEHDKTGLVCVDTFKQLIKETVPPPTFIVKADKCLEE
ncbi:hypothetical protein ILUMI_02481 [Ignelater luminosus]|uniref:EFHB C-terminal EF-hand domain-containing protein n=1 Tax=Ignelater luminosus TaxID=2038154 RepID=A0A8K0DGC7_IGNLU|nr:hypothetical protein ILUMI_02481 [Ignelater luminosus]